MFVPPSRSQPNRSELEPKDTISSWAPQLMGGILIIPTGRIVWFAMQKRLARSVGQATLDFNSSPSSGERWIWKARCVVAYGRGFGIASSGGVQIYIYIYTQRVYLIERDLLDALLIPSWLEVLLICRWKAVQINHKVHNKEVLHAGGDVDICTYTYGDVGCAAGGWASSGTDHGSRCHVSVKMTLALWQSRQSRRAGLWNSYEKERKNRCYPGGRGAGLIVIIVRRWKPRDGTASAADSEMFATCQNFYGFLMVLHIDLARVWF